LKSITLALSLFLSGVIGYSIASFVSSRAMQAELKFHERSENLRIESIAHGELSRHLEYIRLVNRIRMAEKNGDVVLHAAELMVTLCGGARSWLAEARRRAELVAQTAGGLERFEANSARLRKDAESVMSSLQQRGDCS
jgi:hypothetical protein